MTALVTFTAGEPGRTSADAIAALTELGFQFGPPHPVTQELLDTFDGRLHAARLRLELRQATTDLELVLSGEGAVPAHLPVSAAPRFWHDLAPGPFRSRLAAIIEVRALLSLVRVTAAERRGAWLDGAGKSVAVATVFEAVGVEEHPSADVVAWTIEIDEITGYAKRAERAAEALDGIGLTRLGDDTLGLAAAAAGVELAGITGSPTVPLDGATAAIDGFRAVLANLADTIEVNWQGTVDEIDPEFLHDLRVAVRRTRSVLSQGKKVLPAAIAAHAREGFAWLGALTGPARDLDVYLIEWEGYTAPLGADAAAALAPVRLLLEQRSDAVHATLADALLSPEAAELMATWQAWLHAPTDDEPGAQADKSLGSVVTKQIARAQAHMLDQGRMIEAETPAEQVHDLRKDAKKLRYILECFGSLLPTAPRKAFVQRLKALQDNLGEHQDAAVHVAELEVISRELYETGASAETMLAIGKLTERLDQRRAAARAEFAERFAAYDTRATQEALDAALDGVTT